MYTPDRSLLRGLSLPVAECFGKPHYWAEYLSSAPNVKSYRFGRGAPCKVCGHPATNAHHHPPRSKGLLTIGDHVLRPTLFALCGDGVRGCHGKIHNGLINIEWVWFDDEYAKMWWSGELLKSIEPHSDELYEYGGWKIEVYR